MSADKYPSIFSRLMEAIVYIENRFENMTHSGKRFHEIRGVSIADGTLCRVFDIFF